MGMHPVCLSGFGKMLEHRKSHRRKRTHHQRSSNTLLKSWATNHNLIFSQSKRTSQGGLLPAIAAAVRLTGIDGNYFDPEQVFTFIELLWDTGAHWSIIVDEMLSADFREYLKSPLHDPYRCGARVRFQVDANISFSNNLLQINCLCLVVPRSVISNGRVDMILGQSGAIDRIVYKSVSKANLVARGE